MHGIATLGGHSYSLQIRKPAPPVFVVGMAYIIAGCRSLATDFTFFCHDNKTPYIKNNHNGLYENGFYTYSGSRRQAFSKVLHDLVLTVLDDYVRKCCLVLVDLCTLLFWGGIL